MYKVYSTRTGLEIWVGRNHIENEILTFEHSHAKDLWFHVKDYSGAHVLLKYKPDQPYTPEDIHEAAQLAVEHSSNKQATTVTYTECINIEKPKRSRKGTVMILGESQEVHLGKNKNSIY